MSDYERSSQLCEFSTLPAILQVALLQEAQEHDCGQIPDDIQLCLATVSQYKQAGLFTNFKNRLAGLPTSGAVQHSAAIIIPSWLVWAFTHWNSDNQATALSIHLSEAEISEYNQDHPVADYGLNIQGVLSGSTQHGLMFLGLGQSPDAEQFKQHVLQTAKQAKTV